MSDLVEIKRKRFEFLHHLYEQSKGDQYKLFTLSDLARDLHLDVKEAVLIAQYLEGEGLLHVAWTLGGGSNSPISITHLGVIQIEAALSEPDKATQYFPPVVNIIHVQQMFGSQIQQGTQGSTQTGTLSPSNLRGLIEAIQLVKDELSRTNLSGDDRAEAEAEIKTLETQANSPRPKWTIIKESWTALLRIAESVGVPILVEIVKKQLALPS